MRNLSEVIDEILTIIPESEGSLRSDLQRQQQSALYKPPGSTYAWRITSAMLRRHLGAAKPDDGWKLQVHNIFCGETEGGAVQP